MSQDVKRIRVFHLSDLLCPRGLLVADESPMPVHNSELLPVTEHESIVAELNAENERLKRVVEKLMNQRNKFVTTAMSLAESKLSTNRMLEELDAAENGHK